MAQVRLLMEMLHLEKWRHMPLQLQFTSSASLKYLANCPAMPSGMEVGVASLEVTSHPWSAARVTAQILQLSKSRSNNP